MGRRRTTHIKTKDLPCETLTSENVFATVKSVLDETYGTDNEGFETPAGFVANEVAKLTMKTDKTPAKQHRLANKALNVIRNN